MSTNDANIIKARLYVGVKSNSLTVPVVSQPKGPLLNRE